MGPIQSRVFSLVVESGNLATAMLDVVENVNTFLTTLDPNDVADVRYTATPIGKYGERVLYQGVVLYVE